MEDFLYMNKKFEDLIPFDDGWEILTENNFHPLRVVCKTLPDDVWTLKTKNCTLNCADNHIVYLSNGEGIFVCDLKVGDVILTSYGEDVVISIEKNDHKQESMYDVMVDSDEHTYIANGVLCHNTTIVVANLVHYILFNSDKACAILSNKRDQSQEIMSRLQLAYTSLPKWLQVGVVTWNKRSIELENGSSIIATATSSDSVRGKSFSYVFLDECVSGDTTVIILDRETLNVKNITMCELWNIASQNTRYEILTKDGFKDFYGVKKSNGPHRKIIFDDGKELDCALTHRLMNGDEEVYAYTVCVGQNIDGRTVIRIHDYFDSIDLYDVLNVSGNSTYLTNGINSHNCAFIPKNMWKAFFTSTWPTISSGKDSKMTIVSCVTKDTFIYTDKGIECVNDYVKNVIDGAHIVPEYRVLGKDKIRTGHIMVNSGTAKTRNIITTHTSLECSHNHKLYACRGGVYEWIRACDLRKGDYVAVQIGMNQWGNTNKINNISITPDTMYNFGLYLSTGKCSEENLRLYSSIGYDENKHDIPNSVLKINRECMLSLLQGIFENNIVNDRYVYYTWSKNLVLQLRMILLNLGILTYVNYTSDKKWCLCMSVTQSRNFHNVQNDVESFEMSTADIIPYSVDFIRKYLKSKDIGRVGRNTKHISRRKMLTFRDRIKNDDAWNEYFDRNVSKNIVWDVINDIQESENCVYDFSLDDSEGYFSHSVIYNGIVGHQTPNGRNHFYDIWINAKNGKSKFVPSEVNWWEVPGRDEKWREEQLMVMSEEEFNVEYGNSFDATSNTLIAPYIFKKLEENVHPPLQTNGKMRIYELPKIGNNYMATVDCADGGGDYSTISILDITSFPYHQVAVYADNEISHINLPAIIKSMCEKYNDAYVLVESNEIGTTILHILNYDLDYGNIIKTIRSSLGTSVLGQRTTKTTKQAGCMYIKDMIEKSGIIIPDSATVEELRHFGKSGESYAAERGYHDDLVMGLVNFAYYSSTPQFRMLYDTNFPDAFRERYEQEVMENLTPMPLFGNEVLHSQDKEDINWLK